MKEVLGLRHLLSVALAMLLVVFAARLPAQDRVAGEQGPADAPPAIAPADWDAIRQSAERYAAAFNAGDAATIAGLYAENAELVDADGTLFQGRATIKGEYAAFFEAHPGATLRIIVDRLRPIAPTIVAEDGRTESNLGKNSPAVVSRYTALHAKEKDGWRLVSVRDSNVEENDAGAKLEQLSWLIGQWMDEAPDSLMEIDCYWHENGSYIMRDFRIKVEGMLASSGTERIGWDPLKQQIHSWLFDSDGGHLEGSWVREDNQWIVTADGFRADGKPIHATYVMTPLRDDAYHMVASHRTAGQEDLGDFEMTIVRRPPPPGEIPLLKPAADKGPEPNSKHE